MKFFWYIVMWLLFFLFLYSVYEAFVISYSVDGKNAFWECGLAIISVIGCKVIGRYVYDKRGK